VRKLISSDEELATETKGVTLKEVTLTQNAKDPRSKPEVLSGEADRANNPNA
jgi:hypothetical protein